MVRRLRTGSRWRPVYADGVRFMPGDSSLGSAHASQDAPEIAAGNNGFLAVWQDLRTSPFVGPPFSTEGRGFDIYAQLLDAGGAPVGRPFLITSKFGDQKLPQVAWNGQNWLVTWVGPNSTQWNQLIEGMRIAPDGTILDPDAIAIHNTMNQAKYSLTTNSLPAVGAEWLIAVQSNGAGENDIRAVRVSATGTVINPGGTQLRAATSSLYNFEIASAQGEYLLAWGNSSTGPFGNRYDADLNPIPGQFPLNSLNVSSNGSGYFLTWIINDTYWDDFVHGQQLSVDGVAGPVLTLAGTGGGLPLWNPAWSTVAWDGSNWWVSWADRNRGLVVTRVTTSNTVLDFGGLAVDPGAPADAALAHSLAGAPFNTGGGIQAVWEDSREGGRSSPDIYTGSVSGGALPGAGGSLSTATRTQFSTDFAVNGNEAMMVYISQHSGVREILARRLDQDGNALTAEPFLVARGPSIGNPRIGFDDTRYLVVWADESGVVGKRISTAGVVTDTVPLSIMPGGSPDVAGRDGVFLVVNTNATISAHFVDPFSLRIDGATGDALDAAPLSLGFYFARNPRVIAFGGGWLATWQRNISHDDINSSTFAAFVTMMSMHDCYLPTVPCRAPRLRLLPLQARFGSLIPRLPGMGPSLWSAGPIHAIALSITTSVARFLARGWRWTARSLIPRGSVSATRPTRKPSRESPAWADAHCLPCQGFAMSWTSSPTGSPTRYWATTRSVIAGRWQWPLAHQAQGMYR